MVKEIIKQDTIKIKNVLKAISKKDTNEFKLIKRPRDKIKDPKNFMVELGIDFNDVVKIIKGLTISDFVEIIPDIKQVYGLLYVFEKKIESINSYIKIGFKYNDLTDEVTILSFHKSIKGEN